MLKIEFCEPNIHSCECCGNDTYKLTRFVTNNEDAHAVYYISFTKNHDEKVAIGVISLGKWWDEGIPKERVTFPFRIWTTDENFQIGLMDAAESPWNGVEKLGKMLNRQESLKHPWKKEVFHITDHIVTEDKELLALFE